jgi:isopenicillin-N epimerase
MTDLASHWQLDPEITYLNHGSFGACPRVILARQVELQTQMEREPVAFFIREFEPMLDAARESLGAFLGADGADLAFITNATEGVNTVLRSLTFERGDQLLTTDHVYNACRNAMNFVAEQFGAEVVIAPIPFPIADASEVVESVLGRVTERTKLVLLDHITSPTGLILPIEAILPTLRERGIDTLVDGAHAPGMVELDIRALGATYYTGNCHKWLCAPKGAAFLYVQRDRQPQIRPLSISHGANSQRTDRSRFLLEFDWPGTDDPSGWLCVPEAIRFLGDLYPGGWPELRRQNRQKALAGREILCTALGIDAPAPESMIGTLAAVPIPDGAGKGNANPMGIDPLQDRLFHDHRIEVPIMPWPTPPSRLLRISGQAYNSVAQYEALARALIPLIHQAL